MRLGWLGLILVALIGMTSHAQQPIPLEVFVAHDKTSEIAIIQFINPVSGLSTPVTVPNFSRNASVLDEMTLAQNGVIFHNPATNQIMLATPDGRLAPHPFIPRQSEGLVLLEWVLSAGGGSIAWVEVFASPDAWVSNVYIADVLGQSIVQIPAPPPTRINDPYRRIRPLALSDDRLTLFYDAAAPVDRRPLTDYYADFEDLHVYQAATGTFQPLPGEPGCMCGAGITTNGLFLWRSQESARGNTLRRWSLADSSQTLIPAVGPIFAQIGDFFVTDDFALYTQAQNLETDAFDSQFALMLADATLGQQTILIGPSSQRFKVLALTQNNSTVLLGDVYGGGTYKFNLTTSELALVSQQTWLGTLYSR